MYVLKYIFLLGINENLSRIKVEDWILQSGTCPGLTLPLSHPLVLALGHLAWSASTSVCYSASRIAFLPWLGPLSCTVYLNSTTYRQCWRLDSLNSHWNLTMDSRICAFIWSEICFPIIFIFSWQLHFTFLLLMFLCLPALSLFTFLPHI